MMLRHSFQMVAEAARIEAAVGKVLAKGTVTADLGAVGARVVGTEAFGDEVAAVLRAG
jgi:3-isopropylmalate dehydrogenase